jgi:hypothetical protein
MKLKIEQDSLRLRLSESEIEQFVAAGRMKESCSFGSGMELSIIFEVGGSALAASFDDRTLAIAIPRAMAETLTLGGGLGFETVQLNDDGTSLSIVVERDLGARRNKLPVSH